jgi:peptide methionine sulfoxide reductase MsrA
MKYKILTETLFGWAELKYTEDDGKTYKFDLFDTEEEAQNEIKSVVAELGDDIGAFKVVTEDVKADIDLQ